MFHARITLRSLKLFVERYNVSFFMSPTYTWFSYFGVTVVIYFGSRSVIPCGYPHNWSPLLHVNGWTEEKFKVSNTFSRPTHGHLVNVFNSVNHILDSLILYAFENGALTWYSSLISGRFCWHYWQLYSTATIIAMISVRFLFYGNFT